MLAGEIADIIVIGARYISEQQVTNYLRWISEGAMRAGRDVKENRDSTTFNHMCFE